MIQTYVEQHPLINETFSQFLYFTCKALPCSYEVTSPCDCSSTLDHMCFQNWQQQIRQLEQFACYTGVFKHGFRENRAPFEIWERKLYIIVLFTMSVKRMTPKVLLGCSKVYQRALASAQLEMSPDSLISYILLQLTEPWSLWIIHRVSLLGEI